MKKLIPQFTPFDIGLWAFSSLAVILSYVLFPSGSLISTIGSLIGVAALIFIAKGAVLGQMLMVLFALFYGIHALKFQYYGEMLTYLGMSAPAALFNVFSWLRHPYRDSSQVEVAPLTRRAFCLVVLFSLGVTGVFYFLLKALHTARLAVSTVSVATSFFAASLCFLRSPWYAIGYVANDLVLIVLWGLTLPGDPSVLPVLMCFFVFLFNDLHGFFSWQKMKREQKVDF